jgi:hypothetical protein
VTSLIRIALKIVYPERIWREAKTTRRQWTNLKNQRLFFDQIAAKLGILKPSDWYTVSAQTAISLGGSFINNQYKGSLINGTFIQRSLLNSRKRYELLILNTDSKIMRDYNSHTLLEREYSSHRMN